MKTTISELQKIISEYSLKISSMPEDDFSAKPSAVKWSKKEVLGHLIDSAQNNLRRFICGQYEAVPSKIVYDQDHWVTLNAYQQAESKEIIALWVLLNKRIASVLEKMPSISYSNLSDTGKNSIQHIRWNGLPAIT